MLICLHMACYIHSHETNNSRWNSGWLYSLLWPTVHPDRISGYKSNLLHICIQPCNVYIELVMWQIIVSINVVTSSSFQSTVVIPLLLQMVPLIHIKTQLRELRYSSDVTQGLSCLQGWLLLVHLMGSGALTQLILYAHVSIYYSVHTWAHFQFLPLEGTILIPSPHTPPGGWGLSMRLYM